MNTNPNTARTEPRTAAEPATATASASTELRGTSSNKPLSIEKQTGADAPGFAQAVEKSKNERRPITFKAICAIARHVIAHRPHFTDCEWKEAVKVMAARQGWQPPTNAELAGALSAVERAEAKAGRPRQVVTTPAPAPQGASVHAVTRAEAAGILQAIKRDLQQRGLPARGL